MEIEEIGEKGEAPLKNLRDAIRKAIDSQPGFRFRAILPDGVPSVWSLDDPDNPPPRELFY